MAAAACWGCPTCSRGVIYDTASVSSAACAGGGAPPRGGTTTRGRGEWRGVGDLGRRYAVYASEQSHSSVDKAVMTLGLGLDAMSGRSPVDDELPDAGGRTAGGDCGGPRRRGVAPMAVVATAWDDVDDQRGSGRQEIADGARGAEGHLAACGRGVCRASAALAPGMTRHVMDGVRHWRIRWSMNPHKWLFTPFDLSAFYCRRMDEAARGVLADA